MLFLKNYPFFWEGKGKLICVIEKFCKGFFCLVFKGYVDKHIQPAVYCKKNPPGGG
jgi:hypothetical protein